eukprot:TRINITY_DN656_c0_g2_i1.p1 TRINITY_DN656_c0_g2~~TRINITY_DN656_c0_g2_i1.p1  ORF type:complete len:2097 (+),score=317.64 TRINITY_DN656_c0_g2_i1:49-6339(+)
MRIIFLLAVLLEGGAGVGPACSCGHGSCVSGTNTCLCDDSDIGHWAGLMCNDCASGWAGSTCTTPCQGGSCAPCNGHGVCDAGFSGGGSCSCSQSLANGFWQGISCEECLTGYYGPDCKSRCTASACNGHGKCHEGREGDGSCLCFDGWDKTTDCSTCIPSRWGDCQSECVNTVGLPTQRLPCNGHGTCSYGVSGTGECISCDPNWAGIGCQYQCKCLPQHGTCNQNITGDGSCTCAAKRVPPDCASCENGWGGSTCNVACPGTPPCSNNGACDITTATCTCAPGYTKSDCSLACPGHLPCSGHGTCSMLPGGQASCTCAADPADGYWTGADCSQCSNGWSGHSAVTLCTQACLQTPQGVCSGKGICREGVCHCMRNWEPPDYVDYCGDACESTGSQCTGLCGEGLHGIGCRYTCPGFGVAICNGHGRCTKTGVCVCDLPTSVEQWVGSNCDQRCPTSSVGPCSYPVGGACNNVTGLCDCFPGFFGSICEGVCPMSQGMVCNGHGSCSDGPGGSGTCSCDSGWVGPACEGPCRCPRYASCGPMGCVCDQGFTGIGCDICEPGLHGTKCNETCAMGTTVGTDCTCSPYYAGVDCDIECVTVHAKICAGHGSCREGSGNDGGCDCAVDWYGSDCSTWCTAYDCIQNHGLKRAMCNAGTGECECPSHWGGTTCDDCSDDWWGPTCAEKCNCNNHGSCNRETGECKCYSYQGSFTGERCEDCSRHFTGINCTLHKVCTTQGAPLEPLLVDPVSGNLAPVTSYSPYGLWVDTRAGGGYIYTGGNPLVAWGVHRPRDDLTVLNTTSLVSGVLKDMFGIDGNLYIVLAPGRHAATQLVSLQPVPRPPTFGKGSPFGTVMIEALSDTTAEHVASFANTTSTTVVYVQTKNGVRTLHVNVLGCRGTSAVCTSGVVGLDKPADVLAVGPAYIYLGGSVGGIWTMHAMRWAVVGSSVKIGVAEAMDSPVGTGALLVGKLTYLKPIGADGAVAIVTGKTQVDLVKWSTVADKAEWMPLLHDSSELVTALAVDELLTAAFVGVSKNGKPGALMKVSLLAAPLIFDITELSHIAVGGVLIPEVISALYVDAPTRTLYALISPHDSIKIQTFLLWEVGDGTGAAFHPTLVDSAGGTPVTITGRGFRNIKLGEMVPGSHTGAMGRPECSWMMLNKTQLAVTAGVVVNSTVIVCDSPFLDEACNEVVVEVSLDGTRATECAKTVLHVLSPSVTAVVPGRGIHSGGYSVTVHGEGFVNVPALSCRFVLGCDGNHGLEKCPVQCTAYDEIAIVTGTQWVTYISPTEVHCIQPPMTSSGEAILDVTLDGCRPSVHPGTIQMVGEAVGIKALGPSPLEVVSMNEIEFPTLKVAVVDSRGVPLLELHDLLNRPVSVRLNGTGQLHGVLTEFMDSNGTAHFAKVSMAKGNNTRTMLIFDEHISGWTTSLDVIITAGVAAKLVFTTQPSAVTEWNGLPLLTQPVVQLHDDLGNSIFSAEQAYKVTCGVLADRDHAAATSTTFINEIGIGGDKTTFDNVGFTGNFGTTYRLVCQSPGLQTVVSDDITARPCPDYQYQPQNESNCKDCPTEALCDGSMVLEGKTGYWRSENATEFTACPERSGCVGGVTSNCSEGYKGPLCAVCKSGYAQAFSGCVECSPAGYFMMTLLWCVVWVVVMAVAVYSYLQTPASDGEAESKKEAGVRFRILIEHLQHTALLGWLYIDWGSPMTGMLHIYDIFTGPVATDCWLRSIDMNEKDAFIGYMLTPLAACVPAGLVWVLSKRTVPPSRQDAMQSEPLGWWRIASATGCLTVVIAYFGIVLRVLSMLRCTSVEGSSYLLADFRVSCNTAGYTPYQVTAILLVLVYCAGVPAAVAYLGRKGEKTVAAFFIDGYREHVWYWYVVGMGRRVITLMLVVFVGMDGATQLSSLKWVLEAFAIAQYFMKPYKTDVNNFVEMTSLVSSVVTLTLGEFFTTTLSTPEFGFLSFCAIVLNIATTAYILYHLTDSLRVAFAREFDSVLTKDTTPTASLTEPLLNEEQELPEVPEEQEEDEEEEEVDDGDEEEQQDENNYRHNPLPLAPPPPVLSSCLYCQAEFMELANYTGCCPSSPQSGKRHLADLQDVLL